MLNGLISLILVIALTQGELEVRETIIISTVGTCIAIILGKYTFVYLSINSSGFSYFSSDLIDIYINYSLPGDIGLCIVSFFANISLFKFIFD